MQAEEIAGLGPLAPNESDVFACILCIASSAQRVVFPERGMPLSNALVYLELVQDLWRDVRSPCLDAVPAQAGEERLLRCKGRRPRGSKRKRVWHLVERKLNKVRPIRADERETQAGVPVGRCTLDKPRMIHDALDEA